MLPIYKRLRDGGRMLPDGLRYVDSWVEPNFARCFQLMECATCGFSSNGRCSGAGRVQRSRSSLWYQARIRVRSWRPYLDKL